MSAKEYREKNIPELKQELVSLLREQFNLRMQQATQQLKQTHRFREVRRKIAILNTILREKTS